MVMLALQNKNENVYFSEDFEKNCYISLIDRIHE